MTDYRFTLCLKSDAEPASGLGNELLNSLLPRGTEGEVIIPASHLKGIMRENLFRLLSPFRKDADKLCSFLFGNGGENSGSGISSLLHVSNAAAAPECRIQHVTRTAINEDGVADENSLRTVEALATGSCLKGKLSCLSDEPYFSDLCRLALMSISAVGGGRTRGAGACRISIEGFENETPGELLKKIIPAEITLPETVEYPPASASGAGSTCKALKLIFKAEAPLCLPERPMGSSNVITSGFVIPATAVAGTLLTLLSQEDSQLSSDCFKSELFRCFPCLPADNVQNCILPLLVSNSHKISKTVVQESGNYLFGDLMIPDEVLEPEYRWQEKTAGISMKGTGGVLLVRPDSSVELLRAGDIPRYYAAHGVVNGSEEKRDNLFSMESVCVKEFSGIAVLPEKAADKMLEILKDGRTVSFGKSKSTMGNGTLYAEQCNLFSDKNGSFPQVPQLKNRLFIVQSPIVYDAPLSANSKEIINSVLAEAGWGEVERESVTTSVLFGWNNAGLADQIGDTRRVKAQRVIVPGSVFLLKEPLTDMAEKITLGLGHNRYAGYGGVLPHPMFASAVCKFNRTPVQKKTPCVPQKTHPVYCGYRLHEICGNNLSASQIAHLMRCAQISKKQTEEFLCIQKENRPQKFREKWENVHKQISEYLQSYSTDEMLVMFRVWHDLRNGGDEK